MSVSRRIIILEGACPPREIELRDGTFDIGREPGGAIVLSDTAVSRRHARICADGAALVLEDSGSSFGTYLNDSRVGSERSVSIADGDVIRVGPYVRLVCHISSDRSDEQAARDAAFAAQANARFVGLEGEVARRYALAGAETLIGSAAHCDVRLHDSSIPEELALLRALEGAYRIEPRTSAVPLRLNELGEHLTRRTLLESNAVLLVRSVQLLFLYDFDASGRPPESGMRDVSLRRLLRGVAEVSPLSWRELRRVANSVSAGGNSRQRLGEALVERSLITPLTWRVLCVRLAREARHGEESWWTRLLVWRSTR